MSGGQTGYSGHVINFNQRVEEVARVLPHKIALLRNIIVVKSGQLPNIIELNVNKKRVLEALVWLKTNNRFYNDIQIDINNLADNLIEENEFSAIPYLTLQQNSSNSDVDNHSNELIYSDVPNIIINNSRQSVYQAFGIELTEDNCINWPVRQSSPINEFQTDGFIVQAFPCLFAYGEGDFKQERILSVNLREYFQHLMLYKNRRFSRDPRFRYFAMNMIMRWETIAHSSICVKESVVSNTTIQQLRTNLATDKDYVNNILAYNQGIRTTNAYWYQRSKELLKMVETVAAPTLFFTLSAADLFWPQIYKHIDPDFNRIGKTENEIKRRNRKLLNENPMEFAYFFQKRAEIFVKKVIVPKFNVTDYWFRHEFQHRGSPHVHGLLWLEDAPLIEQLKNQNGPNYHEEFQYTLEYFDALITCDNPDKNVIFNDNPCTKLYNEIEDNLHQYDYNCLANFCQRHTKHFKYCFKKNSNICRFGFPKEQHQQSKLILNQSTQQFEFVPKRNDEIMNPHNRFILELWRANMDLQSIVSLYAVLNYIAKYTTKSEKRSSEFEDFLKLFLLNENEFKDMGVSEFVTKTLMKNIVSRDYSAQETCFYLMSTKLVQSSRSFKKIHLKMDNEETFRRIIFGNNSAPDEQSSDVSDVEDELTIDHTNGANFPIQNNTSSTLRSIRSRNYIKEYEERESNFEDYTFPEFFAKTYRKRGSNILRSRGKDIILQITPSIYNQDQEISSKMQIILNFPFRNLNSLYNISWQNTLDDLKQQHPNISNSILTNNIEQDLCDVIENNEQDSSDEEPDKNYREVNQFMALSNTGPNIIMQDFPLGRRDEDILHYDWAVHGKSIEEIN